MCFDFFEQERFDAFEFIVLIPLSTRSMLFMISAYDSIAMYLAIELQSLCFYVIAASKRKSEFSTEAGSKYLILGAHRIKNKIYVALFSLSLKPFFPLGLSLFYLLLSKKFLGSYDMALCLSDEAAGSNNPNAALALPNSPPAGDEPLPFEEPPGLHNFNLPFANFNPLDPVDQFRYQNLVTENALFARIQMLENRLIEGLPPQLNNGEYETLVRQFLGETISISHYESTIAREIFEIQILELKADLLERLTHLLIHETPERLTIILRQSPFPERAIRTEALDFINSFLERLNMNYSNSNFERSLFSYILRSWIQDVELNGHAAAFYRSFLDHFLGSSSI